MSPKSAFKSLIILTTFFTANALNELKSCQDDSLLEGAFCFVNSTYDKSYPSEPFPNFVSSYLWIHEFVDFDTKHQTITMFAEAFVEWNDTRLGIKSGQAGKNLVKWSVVDEDVATKIFTPTLIIEKAKKVEEIGQISSTNEAYFWHFGHHLETKKNLLITFVCSLDFSDFPFDHHSCNFTFGLSGNSINYVQLWPTKAHSGFFPGFLF